MFQLSFVEERSARVHNVALAPAELNRNRNEQFEVKRLQMFQLFPFQTGYGTSIANTLAVEIPIEIVSKMIL